MTTNNKSFKILSIFFIAWFLISLGIYPIFRDDASYKSRILQEGVYNVWKNSLETWSSRNIIEFLQFSLYTIPGCVWIFRIINSGMFTLIGYCIYKIIDSKYTTRKNLILSLMGLFTIPIDQLATAGWIATSANYLWPTALGCYAVLPVILSLQNRPIPFHTKILAALSMIVASNEQQIAAILVGVLVCIILYSVTFKKKLNWFSCLLLVIGIVEIIFHLSWKGNILRTTSEIATWNPEFNMQSTIEKISNGFFSTIYWLLSPSCICIIIMNAALAMVIQEKYKSTVIRSFAWFPCFFFVFFGTLREIMIKIFPALHQIYISSIDTTSWFNSDVWITAIVYFFVTFLVAFNCCLALEGLKGVFIGIIWLGGMLSRVIMGFSPTLYASSTRTFFPLMIISVIIYSITINEYCTLKTCKTTFMNVLLMICTFSYFYLYFLT